MRALLLSPHNEQIAWAAGLFEGEGHARARSDKRLEDYVCPHVNLRMCDEQPVREFARIMGFGTVNRRKNGSGLPHHRDIWCWESGSKRDVPKMEMLLPYLSPRRRQQLQEAFDACVFTDPDLKSQRIKEAQAKRPLRYCECGRGPMPDGAFGRHQKACKEVVPS